jgi:hypothetical protein
VARKYNTRPFNKTGKTRKENRVESAFWKYNKVEDIMLLTSTELDQLIDTWMQDYEDRQIKNDRSWWYPSVTTFTLNDVRNKRTGLDKKPKIY